MHADWLWGLVGGLMIGGAAALYLVMNGKIMGMSSIVGGIVEGSGRSTMIERLIFVAAVILAPIGLVQLGMTGETHLTPNLVIVGAAGLLVGLGTRLAGGCTSGHGVCGMSRLSLRSIVATVFYIMAGGITVLLFRNMLGWI